MHSAEDLHHARQVQKNIIDTIETLNLCIPVLQHYCKLNEQMEQRQYYSALKTLEQLEHTFLPRVRGYVTTSHPTSIEREDLVSYSKSIGKGLFPIIRRLEGYLHVHVMCEYMYRHSVLSIYIQIHLHTRYIFSELLSQEIPKLRTSIEDQSRAELTVRVT